jgi:hypothetical protein
MNESKKISNVGKKWLYLIDVCMSLQDPSTMFTQSELCGVTMLLIYIL